jgi:hypothetical protein
MGDAAIAALVGAAASLLVAFGKVAWDARQSRRNERLAARERLDLYRAPFLAAVDDLGRRINNMRNDTFLAYSEVESRRELAKLSFAFRVAQYLGWVEIVHGYADRLRFEDDETTRMVSATVGDIGWIFSFDEYDRLDQDDFTTSQFMLWREQQRAVGELMRLDGEQEGCLGFASFADNYDRRFRRWLDDFATQAMNPGAARSQRLADLQRALVKLLQQLDVDKVLVETDAGGSIVMPRWARPSNLSPVTAYETRLET